MNFGKTYSTYSNPKGQWYSEQETHWKQLENPRENILVKLKLLNSLKTKLRSFLGVPLPPLVAIAVDVFSPQAGAHRGSCQQGIFSGEELGEDEGRLGQYVLQFRKVQGHGESLQRELPKSSPMCYVADSDMIHSALQQTS